MKKCPFCAEDIKEEATVCKHCNSKLDASSQGGVSSPKLQEFEDFIASYRNGWVLVNKSDKLLSYQKVIPAKKGSCLIALILLCFFFVPGVLYMYFTSKPNKTHQLTVTLNNDNTITPSGDDEGMKVYKRFLNKLSSNN